jgi:hypothetical protein
MHLVTDGNSFFSGYIGKYGLHSPFNRSGLREVCGTREAAEWGMASHVVGEGVGVVKRGRRHVCCGDCGEEPDNFAGAGAGHQRRYVLWPFFFRSWFYTVVAWFVRAFCSGV